VNNCFQSRYAKRELEEDLRLILQPLGPTDFDQFFRRHDRNPWHDDQVVEAVEEQGSCWLLTTDPSAFTR